MKPPHNVAELERALRKIGGTDETGYRLRCIMADVVAGQFLTGAAIFAETDICAASMVHRGS